MKKKRILGGLMALFLLPILSVGAVNRGLEPLSIISQDGEEVGLYQESHALVIGVSDYSAGWPDLPGVKKDVEAIQTTLQEHGFNTVTVTDPSRTELEQAFTDFINTYGQKTENRLLFYFSGHGHTLELAYGDEMGYIVPTDAPNPYEDESGFITIALDMQMIEVYAKRIQAKHALFLFDSCFSGSIFSLSRAAPESISYKTAQPVRQFLTSGSAEEEVPDESIFRQQFVAALNGEGDVNEDGYVTGAELGGFLQETVVNYSKGAQHPQYGKIRHATLDKGDFVFPLQSSPKAAVAAQPAQSSTTRTVADPEIEMWELVKNSDASADVKDFLEAFPDGQYAKVAALKLKQLERQEAETATQSQTDTLERAIVQQPREQPPVVDEQEESSSEGQQELDVAKQTQQDPQPGQDAPAPPPQNDRPSGIPSDNPLTQVGMSLVRLRNELRHVAKEQDAALFEERVDFLEESLDLEIEYAIEKLELNGQDKSIKALERLQEKVPQRLEKMIELADRDKWKDLDKLLNRGLRDLVKPFQKYMPEDGAPQGRKPPPRR